MMLSDRERDSLGRAAPLAALAALAVSLTTSGCTQRANRFVALTDVAFTSEHWDFAGRPGTSLASEHYEIYTTIKDERLRNSLPQAMETAYLFYHDLVPTRAGPPAKMQVYLFAERAEFEHFTRSRFGDERARTLTKIRGGGYTEQGLIVIEYVAHSVTFPVLTHEAFHQYVHYCAPGRIPAWMNEGLSVLCEGQRWGRDGLKSFDKSYNPARRNRLALSLLDERLIPLRELVRINAGHVVGKGVQKAATYYAQLWGLMLFLEQGVDGKYAEGFARLLHTAGRQDLEAFARTAHAASSAKHYNFGRGVFESFVSADIDQVEQEFVTFLRRRILNEKD